MAHKALNPITSLRGVSARIPLNVPDSLSYAGSHVTLVERPEGR